MHAFVRKTLEVPWSVELQFFEHFIHFDNPAIGEVEIKFILGATHDGRYIPGEKTRKLIVDPEQASLNRCKGPRIFAFVSIQVTCLSQASFKHSQRASPIQFVPQALNKFGQTLTVTL